MFSTRLPASLVPTPLSAAVAARRRRHGRLLDLTLSNPTMAGLAYPETLATAFSNVAALRYEPDPRGLRSAREAIARWQGSIGEPVSSDQLVLTASTSEAYSLLFKLLCDPGNRVLVPCPSYPLFEHLAHLDAVAVDRYTFRDAGRWMLDESELRASITPTTRALIVVAPNNPTGHVPTDREWDVFADLCHRHGLALIVDEVFSAYPLTAGVTHVPIPDMPGVLTFRLNGLSKLIGLPQAKLSWILVTGPDDLAQAALDVLDVIADTYLSVATPVQVALPVLLETGAEVRRQILDRVRSNLAHVASRVAGSTIDVRTPDGGWSVVLRVPCVGGPDDLALALLDRDVIVHPGYFYDLPHDGFVVISLLAGEADVREGIDTLCSLPLLQLA
ncbi:Glutamate-pyruvate aminotransferase AlaA [Luteitalea pratensis]|uniref:alanine transaminase n=1 Tax=Luteitalea pratensis TaxID=1855912 RepID=A0A143PHS6_LUTPR|nr:pyridoxal phosphate-dependent aminotransferase [Luteitalea pratensis]AMY07309.1 Glutamate-pyruvate aminotransferase AlaA [Luteitalea pratensis]